MQKKFFPPPPEVVQRARCYLALRLLRAYMDVMGKTRERRFDEHMDKIQRWSVSVKGCWNGGRYLTGRIPRSLPSWKPYCLKSTVGRRRRRRSSIPTGARQSTASTSSLSIFGRPARSGTTNLSEERMDQVSLQTVILGIISILLLNTLQKVWKLIFPQW